MLLVHDRYLALTRQGEFEKKAGGYFRACNLKNKETVVEGIDKAVDALISLFAMKNAGRTVLKLPSTGD